MCLIELLVLLTCQHEGQAGHGYQAADKCRYKVQIEEGRTDGGNGHKYHSKDKEQLLRHCKYLQSYFICTGPLLGWLSVKGCFLFLEII